MYARRCLVRKGDIYYPLVKGITLQTDAYFRNKTNEEHHNCTSPFSDLPVDMVKQFPVDYMHQLCLGVVKKLILAWMRGKREVKISAVQVEAISTQLVSLKSSIPKKFARKPRSLANIDRW